MSMFLAIVAIAAITAAFVVSFNVDRAIKARLNRFRGVAGPQPVKLYLLKLRGRNKALEFENKWTRNILAFVLDLLGKNPQVAEILVMEESL